VTSPVRRRRSWQTVGNTFGRQAPATTILILVNVFWYVVIESITGRGVYGLVGAGAMFGSGVEAGQWYRLFTAMFVHISIIHIGLNMISLASLYVVEVIIGSWPFVFVYFLSGFVGNVVGLWLLPGYEVAAGASGAIFGIFAAALALSFRGYLNKSARNQLLILLVINLVYGFSSAAIDNTAHIGGLITGILMTLGLIRWARYRRLFQGLGMVSAAVAVVALLWVLVPLMA